MKHARALSKLGLPLSKLRRPVTRHRSCSARDHSCSARDHSCSARDRLSSAKCARAATTSLTWLTKPASLLAKQHRAQARPAPPLPKLLAALPSTPATVRHGVLYRKGSYGTHSEEDSRFIERILSVQCMRHPPSAAPQRSPLRPRCLPSCARRDTTAVAPAGRRPQRRDVTLRSTRGVGRERIPFLSLLSPQILFSPEF